VDDVVFWLLLEPTTPRTRNRPESFVMVGMYIDYCCLDSEVCRDIGVQERETMFLTCFRDP
jgi:hypothetical protein